MGTKDRMKAVYDDDLGELLSSLGLVESVEQGKVRCRVCGEQQSIDSIGVLVPNGDRVEVVCSDPECLVDFYQQLSVHGK